MTTVVNVHSSTDMLTSVRGREISRGDLNSQGVYMRRGPLLCILSQAEQPEAENNQIPAMAQKSKRLGLEAVSYTHLDVYKRQGLGGVVLSKQMLAALGGLKFVPNSLDDVGAFLADSRF